MDEKTTILLLKVAELALAVLVGVLHYLSFTPYASDKFSFFLISGVYCGYIFVFVAMLVMAITSDEEQNKIVMYFFVISSTTLYIASTAITIITYSEIPAEIEMLVKTDLWLVKAIFSAILSGVLVYDVVFRIIRK